ncbi:J domain-containing protein [Flavobacteriaceae bacterium]|nr:J domain-containing protein [Flavobacteriaceae bacterium]
MINYYKILGLENGASQEDIQNAYERLSIELNPANNDNLDFFVEEYQKIQEAYTALTGKKPEEKNEIDAKPSQVPNVFEDSDTLVSILKKFKASENAKKLEIINSLEAFKKGNKTYQQALAMLYKKEDIESIKDVEENENSSNLNTAKEVSPLTDEKEPITPLNKKPSKKTKKILLGSLIFLTLFFGITYIYFLVKANDFKNEIPRIIEQSEYNQNNSRKIWETKFFENHPEIVNKHLTDGTNKGFLFKETDRIQIVDSTVNFFIYSKTFPLKIYKPDFFECVYYNAVNLDNFWNHYIVGLGENKKNSTSLPPYLEMLRRTKKNHKVSEKEFEDLIQMVGGLKVFQQKKLSNTDVRCEKCVENYQNTFETNTMAINDFYDFTDEYLTSKNKIKKQNASFLKIYDKTYRRLTADMSNKIREKLKSKLDEKSFPLKKSEAYTFSGFNEGLGDISYTIEKYNDDLSSLKDYVNETYASYYSTNSLYTGATPYRYCYGRNPYCSPPYGYEECSFIDIKASSNSDVVVIVKKNNRVYSHAYIKAGGYHKFKVGNGSFQTFFYYGKGWNPNKYIKNSSCGKITGGFVSNESLDKSDVIRLNNSSMSYTLYTVENGNFKPKASNKNEAF